MSEVSDDSGGDYGGDAGAVVEGGGAAEVAGADVLSDGGNNFTDSGESRGGSGGYGYGGDGYGDFSDSGQNGIFAGDVGAAIGGPDVVFTDSNEGYDTSEATDAEQSEEGNRGGSDVAHALGSLSIGQAEETDANTTPHGAAEPETQSDTETETDTAATADAEADTGPVDSDAVGEAMEVDADTADNQEGTADDMVETNDGELGDMAETEAAAHAVAEAGDADSAEAAAKADAEARSDIATDEAAETTDGTTDETGTTAANTDGVEAGSAELSDGLGVDAGEPGVDGTADADAGEPTAAGNETGDREDAEAEDVPRGESAEEPDEDDRPDDTVKQESRLGPHVPMTDRPEQMERMSRIDPRNQFWDVKNPETWLGREHPAERRGWQGGSPRSFVDNDKGFKKAFAALTKSARQLFTKVDVDKEPDDDGMFGVTVHRRHGTEIRNTVAASSRAAAAWKARWSNT